MNTDDVPQTGGSLFLNTDGIAGCPRCAWRGIPSFTGGRVPVIRIRPGVGERRILPRRPRPPEASTFCPSCQRAPDPSPGTRAVRAPRNVACPCGSGVKAKRCACEAFTV